MRIGKLVSYGEYDALENITFTSYTRRLSYVKVASVFKVFLKNTGRENETFQHVLLYDLSALVRGP